MTQKDSQKKRDIVLEEEKDFYLSYVNKKLRNTRKKLEQIDALLKKEQSTLKPEQIEKIRSRDEVLDSIKHLEDLKDTYYAAYKLGLEEGKVTLPERSSETASDKNQHVAEAPKAEKAPKSESDGDHLQIERVKEETVMKTVKKVLNLLFVGQFFDNSANKDAYIRKNEQQSTQTDDLQNLYKLISAATLVDESIKVGEKYNQVCEKLVGYVKENSDNTKVFDFVEGVVSSTDFKDTLLTPPSKVQEDKIDSQVKVEPVKTEEVLESSNIILELLPGAAFLKPDTDDVNKTHENMKYLPKDIKTLKYVDELEKEQKTGLQTNQATNETNTQAEEKVLKESADDSVHNANEKKEEKSFRKNKYNQNGKQRTENRVKASGSSGIQGKREDNHKENKEDGERGHGNGKRQFRQNENYYKKKNFDYEVREYVQKKPSENKA